MATKTKPTRIELMTTSDGEPIALVPEGKGYIFQATERGSGEEIPVALTAAEWGQLAIKLLLKCPEAKDMIGLVSAKAEGLTVTGTTLPSRRKWTATFTDVGSDQNGRGILEWESSRPLALYEIGKVFKAAIARLSELADGEDW
jgi:hypothetical protein